MPASAERPHGKGGWLTDLLPRSAYAGPMSFPDASALDAARSGPFFVVINAGAGHQNADDAQQVMARVFRRAGREVEFLLVGKTDPIEAVARRAVALAQARQGVVVAAGGDGTINAVASAVFGSGCPFGVLPQGTFNYFGRANGISQDTEAAATALVNARISPVQAGQVNGRIFLVNASVGLYPQLLEDREAWKRRFGRSRLVAFISGMATLLQARKQLHLLIESGGRVTAVRTPTLFVGNNDLQLAQVGIVKFLAPIAIACSMDREEVKSCCALNVLIM